MVQLLSLFNETKWESESSLTFIFMYNLKIYLGLHRSEIGWQNNIHEGEQLINTIHKYEGNVPGTGAVSFL